MRIVGGALGGRRLAPLGRGDSAARLRPTADRTRESLFNVLESRFSDRLQGCRALDLFAGTGALGLEALSRGAAEAAFVDNGRAALDLLRRNISLLGVGARCRVLARDACRLGPAERAHDLAFLDPPYGQGLGERAAAAALEGGWLADGALVVWEERAQPEPPAGLRLLDARRSGAASVCIFEASVAAAR